MRAASTPRSTWRPNDYLVASLGLLALLRTDLVPAQSDRSQLGPDGPAEWALRPAPGRIQKSFHAQLQAPQQPAPAPQGLRRDNFEEALLEVDINQQGLDETALFLRTQDGMLWMAEDDLQRWRLRKPDSSP